MVCSGSAARRADRARCAGCRAAAGVVSRRQEREPGPGGLGYLLKDRLGEVSEFLGHLERVADGHTVIDPEVVRHVLAGPETSNGLARLTAREQQVLHLMAQGLTNADIAGSLVLTDSAVVKHVGNIFAKLDLDRSDGNRRVLAVLTYLQRS